MKRLGLDLFLSRNLYGPRPLTHVDAYVKAPGWYAVELGGFTLEIDVEARLLRRSALIGAVAALLLRPLLKGT